MAIKSLTGIANNHDFEISYTNEFDNDQTNGVILTPTSGKSLRIVGYNVSTTGTSGYVRLTIVASGAADTIGTHFASSGAPTSGYVPVLKVGDRNATVKVTSTLGASKNYSILINYQED